MKVLFRLAILSLLLVPLSAPLTLVQAQVPLPKPVEGNGPNSLGSAGSPSGSAQDGNLLINGGFENPYSAQTFSSIIVAAGWTAWWVKPDSSPAFPGYCDYRVVPPSCQPYHQPEYGMAYPYGERIRSGGNAQKYFTFYSTHLAGLYQQVANVTPGQNYRFTVYVETWSTAEEKGFTSAGQPSMGVMVGIDPTGYGDPFSPVIIWSYAQNAFDVWTPMSVDAVAQSTNITVFTRSQPALALQHNDVYLDDASLVAVGAPGPAPTTDSGQAPAATSAGQAQAPHLPNITSTPLPNGEVWYVVQPGDSLGRIALLHNTTVDAIKQLNNLSNNNIIIGQKLLALKVTPEATATETATATPEITAAPTETPLPMVPPATSLAATQAAESGHLCVVAYLDTQQTPANGTQVQASSATDIASFSSTESGPPQLAVSLQAGDTLLNESVPLGDPAGTCFPEVPPGSYTVSASAPTGFSLTGASTATVQLRAKNTTTLGFGLAPSGAAGSSSNTAALLAGAGGLALVVAALGVGAVWWVRRRG